MMMYESVSFQKAEQVDFASCGRVRGQRPRVSGEIRLLVMCSQPRVIGKIPLLLPKVVESLSGAVYLRVWHATSDCDYYAFHIQRDRGPQKD